MEEIEKVTGGLCEQEMAEQVRSIVDRLQKMTPEEKAEFIKQLGVREIVSQVERMIQDIYTPESGLIQ